MSVAAFANAKGAPLDTVRDNVAFGLRLLNDVGYRGNVITDNLMGTVSLGVNLGANFCAGPGVVSATCP